MKYNILLDAGILILGIMAVVSEFRFRELEDNIQELEAEVQLMQGQVRALENGK